MACAFGSERSRYPDAIAIQSAIRTDSSCGEQYSGIAPVTEKSGKNRHWVHRGYNRPHFIHQSFFEYASQSALHCEWAKLFLQAQIAKGKSHSSALVFKWSRSRGICLLARSRPL